MHLPLWRQHEATRGPEGVVELARGPEDIQAIRDVADDSGNVTLHVKRLVESKTERSVVTAAWLEASRSLFRESVIQRLAQLEHNDFEDIDSVKKSWIEGASNLQSIGLQVFKRSGGNLQFMSLPLVVNMESVVRAPSPSTRSRWSYFSGAGRAMFREGAGRLIDLQPRRPGRCQAASRGGRRQLH